MAKVIFPLVHYQTSHESIAIKGEKNLFCLECLGKTEGTCFISKGKQNNDEIKGVHKVALRNSPGSRGVSCFQHSSHT